MIIMKAGVLMQGLSVSFFAFLFLSVLFHFKALLHDGAALALGGAAK